MRILWVKAGGLLPPDTGGRIRSFNILRQLARHHEVTLFSFHDTKEDAAQRPLDQLFHRLVCVPLALPAKRRPAELLNYAAGFFSSEPYNLTKYCRPEVKGQLDDLIRRETYDVVVCDFLMAAGVIPWSSRTPKVLFAHNVEAAIWRHHYRAARNPVWKAIAWREMKRMEAAERKYLTAAHHVFAVSLNDRECFGEFLSPNRITVIPTGVDVESFKPYPTEEDPLSLVFTGSMDWLPNEDAVLYLVNQILPLVRQQFPQVSLSIVGRNPSATVRTLAARDSRLQVTGTVPDIRPFLACGAVVVVPLRIGGGTRLKIFEAMAMEKAIVSTTLGAEGLPVQDGENILLADTPSDFAASVTCLLRDTGLRTRMGMSARRLVEKDFSWEDVARQFASALQAVVTGHLRESTTS